MRCAVLPPLLLLSLATSDAAVTLATLQCAAPGEEGAAAVGEERYRETSFRCRRAGETVYAALPGEIHDMKGHGLHDLRDLRHFPLATWVETQASLENVRACAPEVIDRAYFGAPRGAVLHVLTRAQAPIATLVDGVPIRGAQLLSSPLQHDGLHVVEWRLEFGCLESLPTSGDGFRAARQLAAWWEPGRVDTTVRVPSRRKRKAARLPTSAFLFRAADS